MQISYNVRGFGSIPRFSLYPLGPEFRAFSFFMIDYSCPKPLKIKRLREQASKKFNLNINQARLWCAQAVLVRPNLFLDWESGAYDMPPGLFQLLQLKLLVMDSDLMSPISVPGRAYIFGSLKMNTLDPTPRRYRKPTPPAKKAP